MLISSVILNSDNYRQYNYLGMSIMKQIWEEIHLCYCFAGGIKLFCFYIHSDSNAVDIDMKYYNGLKKNLLL